MVKRILFKTVSLTIILCHLFVVCLQDVSFAQETSSSEASSTDSSTGRTVNAATLSGSSFSAASTSSGSLPTLMPNSFGGTSVDYSYHTNVNTGKANLSLSFEIPPGRNGMQPSLGILYENSQVNSFLGIGWIMDLGSISSSTKKGIPRYDYTDNFVFTSTGSSKELVNTSGSEYHSQIESDFTKYIFHGSWWEATDKAGTKYRFGYNSDSRQDFSGLGTFKWCLDRVTDIHGNYIQISYQLDQGEIYPYKIEYTGFGYEAPRHGRIEFVLEPRDDFTINYRTKSKVVMAKRLKEILVYQNTNFVRGYEFNYTYSNDTNRSLLTSITQYAEDNLGNKVTLPPLEFNYSQSLTSWQEDSNWAISDLSFIRTDQTGGTLHPSYTNRDQGRRLFDMNGDGLTDLIIGN